MSISDLQVEKEELLKKAAKNGVIAYLLAGPITGGIVGQVSYNSRKARTKMRISSEEGEKLESKSAKKAEGDKRKLIDAAAKRESKKQKVITLAPSDVKKEAEEWADAFLKNDPNYKNYSEEEKRIKKQIWVEVSANALTGLPKNKR